MNKKEFINYAANEIRRELKKIGDLETITPADVAALSEIGFFACSILKTVKETLRTNNENN